MFVCNCWYYFMVQFFSNNYTTLYFIKYWLFIVNLWLSYIAHKLLIFLSYDFVLVNFLLLFCRIYNFILIQMRLFLPHNLFNIYIYWTLFLWWPYESIALKSLQWPLVLVNFLLKSLFLPTSGLINAETTRCLDAVCFFTYVFTLYLTFTLQMRSYWHSVVSFVPVCRTFSCSSSVLPGGRCSCFCLFQMFLILV